MTGAVEHIPANPLALLDKPAAAPMTANVNIALHAMPIDKLGGFWPPTLSGHTRSWIMSNMSAGSIDDLRFAVAATLQPGAETPFDVSGFSGAMTVKGTNVEYMRGLPRVEGIDSNVTFQPKKLEFALSSGRLKGLNISQGTIVIDQFDQPFERTTIDLALAGPAQDGHDGDRFQAAGLCQQARHRSWLAARSTARCIFSFPLRNSLPLSRYRLWRHGQADRLAVGKVALAAISATAILR
ncbi:MAG: DUF3971 domain-containing protein [Aliidongia sp.]